MQRLLHRRPRLLRHVERTGDDTGQQIGAVCRREVDEPRAVRERADNLEADLLGEPGLAGFRPRPPG